MQIKRSQHVLVDAHGKSNTWLDIDLIKGGFKYTIRVRTLSDIPREYKYQGYRVEMLDEMSKDSRFPQVRTVSPGFDYQETSVLLFDAFPVLRVPLRTSMIEDRFSYGRKWAMDVTCEYIRDIYNIPSIFSHAF